MPYAAERMRERITIQAPTRTGDDGGGVTVSWNTYATLWAEALLSRGEESLVAAQHNSRTIARLIIRHHEGISTEMRVLHGGRTYNIRAVLFDYETRDRTILQCEEILT